MATQDTGRQVIAAETIVLPDRILADGAIAVRGGMIEHVGHRRDVQVAEFDKLLDFGNRIVAPGFIDIHIHGFDGVEVGESVSDTLHIAQVLAGNGVTAFLPTVAIAPSFDEQLRLLAITAEAIKQATAGAEMLGIHLEAPFLSRAGKGTWDRYPPSGLSAGKSAREPSLAELDQLCEAADGRLRIMSIAPELDGALDVIAELSSLGIVASAAHTTASYEQTIAAIQAGMKSATHLYNGMRRQDHREPGVIEAVLTSDALMAEIIGDCVHVLPAAVDIAIRCKGVDRIILITDNTRYAGMPNGIYPDSDGREIVKDDEKAHIPGWTLAGSVSPMNRNVGNMLTRVGQTLPNAVRMASLNPARLLGIDTRKGSLEAGKDADLVVIDEQVNVYATMTRGTWQYGLDEVNHAQRL